MRNEINDDRSLDNRARRRHDELRAISIGFWEPHNAILLFIIYHHNIV